jgi:hypothetical protein
VSVAKYIFKISVLKPISIVSLFVAGVLFILGFWIVGLQQYPNPGTHLVSLLPTLMISALQSKATFKGKN